LYAQRFVQYSSLELNTFVIDFAAGNNKPVLFSWNVFKLLIPREKERLCCIVVHGLIKLS